DKRGRVAWVNRAAARLHGTTPDKLVGADIRSLWPHAPVPPPLEPETKVEHAMINGRPVWLRVTRFPVGREVVAVSEVMTESVELGAFRSLARLLTRTSRATMTPDPKSAAAAHAFARGRSADDMIESGAMPSEI